MKKKNLFIAIMTLAVSLLAAVTAFAADAPKIDTGDTTFIIMSTAFVFLMTPGLAFFYGGMVRQKNVLNTMMTSFVAIALISLQWILFGYSFAFGPDQAGVIGSFDWVGLSNVTTAVNADYAATIPHQLFMMYQMMFAIITVALISGAFAERMKFGVVVAFTLLWSTLVYDPLAHWVWGVGGWLRVMGALDFAGGNVVHISSGVAGLVVALVIGKRKGYGHASMLPHNIPFVLLGAAVLWFGWFGFNAGSALGSSELAINAFVTTNTAAAAATLSWILLEWLRHGKPTIIGAATGAVVGLVAITPGAGFVTPMASIIIGLAVSPICYFAISYLKPKLGYDDALDAFGCHGIGGIWGGIATGLFATKAVNSAGADGLFYGNPNQLVIQVISIVVTIAFSAIVSFIILKVIGLFTKLRVSEEDENVGLDYASHGENAYRELDNQQGMSV